MVWLMVWVGAAVASNGTRAVTKSPHARPDEAYYVVRGPVFCPVQIAVGPSGRPVEARATGCAPVLSHAIEEAAMRWRFAPRRDTRVEEVELEVRPPSMAPRPRRGACLVGVRVNPEPELLADVPTRCGVQVPSNPTEWVPGRRATQQLTWCEVGFRMVGGAMEGVTAAACAPEAVARAVALVRGWSFAAERDQEWRVVLGLPKH